MGSGKRQIMTPKGWDMLRRQLGVQHCHYRYCSGSTVISHFCADLRTLVLRSFHALLAQTTDNSFTPPHSYRLHNRYGANPFFCSEGQKVFVKVSLSISQSLYRALLDVWYLFLISGGDTLLSCWSELWIRAMLIYPRDPSLPLVSLTQLL